MMRPLVKICGLSTRETLDAALGCGVDMVGFVFFAPSPRHIDLPTARDLGQAVGNRALRIALTVDADDAYLADIVAALRPGMLQLHGHESVERVHAIKRTFGLPVIKAIPIAIADDLRAVPPYAGAADLILFDARAPKDATRPGGLGRAFDWHLLQGLDLPMPFLLSGGLDPDNVGRAIEVTHPHGVDVSSGVESAPGVKDVARIRAFVAAARAAGTATAPSQTSTPIASSA
jgi:phosphoribosylanthranilate isomerase